MSHTVPKDGTPTPVPTPCPKTSETLLSSLRPTPRFDPVSFNHLRSFLHPDSYFLNRVLRSSVSEEEDVGPRHRTLLPLDAPL